MKAQYVMIIFFLFLAFLILLHQFLLYGVWFQIKDLHHETFALMCLAAAFGILIGNIGTKRNNRPSPSD
jgi:hypothetical protein